MLLLLCFRFHSSGLSAASTSRGIRKCTMSSFKSSFGCVLLARLLKRGLDHVPLLLLQCTCPCHQRQYQKRLPHRQHYWHAWVPVPGSDPCQTPPPFDTHVCVDRLPIWGLVFSFSCAPLHHHRHHCHCAYAAGCKGICCACRHCCCCCCCTRTRLP